MLRERAGRFEFLADLFGIHLFPTVQVFVGMLPAYVAATHPGDGLTSLARRPQYADVIDRVPRLVPRPPRRAPR